jgi:hypothetical protein
MKIRLSKDAPEQKHPIPCAPGAVIEVPDDLGKSLLAQTDKWQPATKSKD